MSSKILTYAVFHLNMSFSSIEESDRPAVVEHCYWPLLRLIQEGYPLAIEASALTLQYIQEIDQTWMDAFRTCVQEDACEFIGSGFAQAIGPLMPYALNRKNLSLGMQAYEEILGQRPRLALVNEMAYAPNLVDLYLEAGFEAILMDWANPYSHNRERWDANWRYYPQRARGTNGNSIPLVWLDSFPFQTFQRYVYGEMDELDMLEYLEAQAVQGTIAFPLYGNDAEIFDYRPGRFETEPVIGAESEWDRIRSLLHHISERELLEIVHPSRVLELTKNSYHSQVLQLETPNWPIPVKKQPKYNVMRWAATGRDDLWANTACWRVFRNLMDDPNATDEQWRALCRLWGSDYRTHITEMRWKEYSTLLAEAGAYGKPPVVFDRSEELARKPLSSGEGPFSIREARNQLIVEGPSGTVILRMLRGMAIEGFWPFGDEQSVFRTLPHGYFSDINWGVDFYSGHLIAQLVGKPKVTDLEKVDADLFVAPDGAYVDVEATIKTLSGPLFKRIRIFADQPRIEVRYRIGWLEDVQGSIHFGNITLNPAGFDRSQLFYATHNGGQDWECHSLADVDIDQMRAPSFLVSTRTGLGMTEGKVLLGDDKRQVLIECPREIAAMPGLLTCQTVMTWKGASFFCRLALSGREIDDTAKPGPHLPIPGRSDYMYAVTALKGWEGI